LESVQHTQKYSEILVGERIFPPSIPDYESWLSKHHTDDSDSVVNLARYTDEKWKKSEILEERDKLFFSFLEKMEEKLCRGSKDEERKKTVSFAIFLCKARINFN
jgi:hypothetical protein